MRGLFQRKRTRRAPYRKVTPADMRGKMQDLVMGLVQGSLPCHHVTVAAGLV